MYQTYLPESSDRMLVLTPVHCCNYLLYIQMLAQIHYCTKTITVLKSIIFLSSLPQNISTKWREPNLRSPCGILLQMVPDLTTLWLNAFTTSWQCRVMHMQRKPYLGFSVWICSWARGQYAVWPSLAVLGSGSEPQFPGSHTILRANNHYTDSRSVFHFQ